MTRCNPLAASDAGPGLQLRDSGPCQIFLHVAERTLDAELAAGKPFGQACYMPTAADTYVIAFRNWLASHAGGRPAWAPGTDLRLPPVAPDRAALLDRWVRSTSLWVAAMRTASRKPRAPFTRR